jgi:hypothetical protein
MHRRRKISFGLLGLFCVAAAAAAGLSNGILVGSRIETLPRHEARAGRAWLVNDTIAVCRYVSLSGTAEVRIPADGIASPCKLIGPAA